MKVRVNGGSLFKPKCLVPIGWSLGQATDRGTPAGRWPMAGAAEGEGAYSSDFSCHCHYAPTPTVNIIMVAVDMAIITSCIYIMAKVILKVL